ncbi:hypothetical protein Hanom_Chr06g00578061 [Helianthus anomalus]
MKLSPISKAYLFVSLLHFEVVDRLQDWLHFCAWFVLAACFHGFVFIREWSA